MTSLNDQMRLEILATTSGNAIANHSAQGGTTAGWALTPSPWSGASSIPTGAALTAATGKPFGYGGKAISVKTGSAFGLPANTAVASDKVTIVGNQWINFAANIDPDPDGYPRAYALGVQFFNAANVKIGTTVWTNFQQAAPNTGVLLTLASPPSGGFQSNRTLQAPSGTAYARVTVDVNMGELQASTFPTNVTSYLSKVMVVVGNTQASVAGPVFSDLPETWQNLLPKAIRANVTRGGDVDGVTDNLEAGLMVASIKDPQVTPDNNDRVRPGRPIRLLALNGSTWQPVFRGKIVQASTSYAGDVPVVNITATDAMADLENFPQPVGKSGTFKQRVITALTNVPGVSSVITDAAANVTQATISANDNGTALSQLREIRDSLRGLFYVDKSNVLQAFAQASYPSQAPTILFTDQPADGAAAVHYTGIETNFDSKNLVNSLLVSKTALSEADGTKVYGPYVNQASVDAWGPVSATLEVNDGTPATLAAAYLAVYAEPKIFTDSVTFNATDNIGKAIARELYEAARVKFAKAGVDAVYRIIAIEHEITAKRWITTIRFKPLESTSSITVTNPPGGAATGPKDLVPFTREVQNGERSITTTTNNVAVSGAITFPKPYESTPRVFATARSSVPGTRVGEVTALNITTTGCDLYVSSPSNPGAIAVQWVAFPAT